MSGLPTVPFDPEQKKQVAALPVVWAADCEKVTATPYIFKGVIERGVTGIIYGPSNCGKTFLALDMALRAACGIEWQGHRVNPCGVLYLAAEGKAGIRKRVIAWKQANQKMGVQLPFGHVEVSVNLLDGDDPERVVQTVLNGVPDHMSLPQIGWVIVDTVAQTMRGGDENSNTDMAQYAGNLQAIAAATGASVFGIHHPGKDASKGARGGSALKSAVDTEIEVSGEGDIRTATVRKQRDGETGRQYNFSLDQVEVGTDGEGDAITTCLVRYVTEVSAPLEQKLSANQRTMLGLLEEAGAGGLTKDEWNRRARDAGLAKSRDATLWDLRDALKSKGRIYEYQDRWYVQVS